MRLMLSAGAARSPSSRQLERGDASFTGSFGIGAGKWRLFVSADRPLLVMSLMLEPDRTPHQPVALSAGHR